MGTPCEAAVSSSFNMLHSLTEPHSGDLRHQGLYASLELLPMWSGIESDVQLFASGRVLHDDGEWAGGQSLGEGSGSGMIGMLWLLAAGSARTMRLSSCKERFYCNIASIVQFCLNRIVLKLPPVPPPPLTWTSSHGPAHDQSVAMQVAAMREVESLKRRVCGWR